MTLPNFLIIGPGKTGSTSLWHYVRQHPDVFMSDFKEPSFFWTEAPNWKENRVQTLQEYEKLFESAGSSAAVGEASATYFADPGAPTAIKETLPDVRLIAILRDPRSRAFSQYVFQRMRNFERAESFLEAVAAEPTRSREELASYIDPGLYHKHLTRYLAEFPWERLHLVFTDDLRAHPDDVMRDIFRFLGVDPSVEVDTSSDFTVSGRPRIKAVDTLMSNKNPLKRILGAWAPEWARKAVRRLRNSNLERLSMTAEERQALRPYFEDDIKQLETLLERDLSGWLAD